MHILNEASNSKRKYKCPYCEFRTDRVNLVYHVSEEHEELIPEGYTAARVVFNMINNKTNGTCIMCGAETDWNEKSWRYERLCGKKKCHDDYVKMVNERMMKKYNKTNLLDDPEHQKKMLEGRKISGNYKFRDGGVRSYCGSYEKKALEFYDKVLEVHSNEIMTPGPTIEYEYNGEKHFWITDIYYITANLVHDVKDGGSNPNKRNMEEYREKQIAKEKAIADANEYNYIRLTDNNFQQLLFILADIKEQLLSPDADKNERKIHINESVVGGMPPAHHNDIYVVQNYINSSFVKDGISFSKGLDDIYEIEDGVIVKKKANELNECAIFKYNIPNNEIKEMIESAYSEHNKVVFDPHFFYKLLTEKEVLSSDQIAFDSSFTEVNNIYSQSNIMRDIYENTLMNINNSLYIPVIENTNLINANRISKEYSNISILQDANGYFAYNIHNNNRTGYFESVEAIPSNVLEILDKTHLNGGLI